MVKLAVTLKWAIYMVSGLTILLSIVTTVVDHHDTESFGEKFVRINIALLIIMATSGSVALFHYYSPRPGWIIFMILLSVVLLIMRGIFARKVNLSSCGIVIINALLGCVYIYLIKADTAKLPDIDEATAVGDIEFKASYKQKPQAEETKV